MFKRHIEEIDSLRAIAVVAVLLFHLNSEYLPGGFSGVDIFFVISGYVISRSFVNQKNKKVKDFVLFFYAKRFVRIVPALLITLITGVFLYTLFVPIAFLSDSIKDTALAAFWGVSNFALIASNDGYFSPRPDYNLFTHTWSLSVEEQFYFIFPFLFWFWLSSRNKKKYVAITSLILPTLTLLSLLFAFWASKYERDWGYYLLFSRFWELAAGALLFRYHYSCTTTNLLHHVSRIKEIVGLALIFIGFYYSEKNEFPFPWAFLPVLGSLLLIDSFISGSRKGVINYIFRISAIRYVGKISYSLYLWHWIVFSTLRWTIGLESVFEQVLAVVSSYLIAILSYHGIEQPVLRFYKHKEKNSFEVVNLSVFCIAVVFFGSYILFQNKNQFTLSVTGKDPSWFSSKMVQVDNQSAQFSNKRLFVIGDSHAVAYTVMINNGARYLGYEVKSYYVPNNCPIVQLIRPAKNDIECKNKIQKLLEVITYDGKPGDAIFFASLRTYRLSDQWVKFDKEQVLDYSESDDAFANVQKAQQDAATLISDLSDLGIKVIIDMPKPVFLTPPFRCSDWFNSTNPMCDRGFTVERDYLMRSSKFVREGINTLKKHNSNVFVWDPFPILCNTKTCSTYDKNGLPLFFDGDHLSVHGNDVLLPDFMRVLNLVWELE